jgi:Glycosyl hydrolase family 26
MSFDGQPDPRTRPLPQGGAPSPYGTQPSPGQGAPYGEQSPYPQQPPDPYATQPAPTQPRRAEGTASLPAGWNGPQTQVFDQPGTHRNPAGGTPPREPGRRGWRSPKILVPVVVVVLLVLAAGIAFVALKLRDRNVTPEEAPDGTPAATGSVASMPPGRTWLSGAWTGTGITKKRIDAFSEWRGQPADVVTTYPSYDTWEQLKDAEWSIAAFDGFKGKLALGLPLLPKKEDGSLGDVADGQHDDVFRAIAKDLVDHDRGDTFLRIGLEANGKPWFPWGSDAERADRYKAAWRHVQSVMKEVAPKLSFGFDITCGKALEGGSDRMDSLTKLYPGDDVVDVVGCDHYDSYTVKTRNADEWKNTLRPEKAVGLADVAQFARDHDKKLAVPEWGLTAKDKDGAGDNPFFIYSMYGFFQQNKDILAYENYFNEPDDYLGSAIDNGNNPKAAAEYRKLWGAEPALKPAG